MIGKNARSENKLSFLCFSLDCLGQEEILTKNLEKMVLIFDWIIFLKPFLEKYLKIKSERIPNATSIGI